MVLENPSKYIIQFNTIIDESDKLFSFSKDVLYSDPKIINHDEILKILNNHHLLIHNVWSIAMPTNLLEMNQSFLSDFLQCILLKKGLSNDQIITLTTPDKITPAELIFKSDLNNYIYYLENAWIYYGWNGPVISKKDFEDKINENRTESANQELLFKQERLAVTYSLDDKTLELIELLKLIIYSKKYRTEAVQNAYYSNNHLMEFICKSKNTERTLIDTLHGEMLNQFLNENITVGDLRDYYSYSCFIKEDNKLNFYSGSTAKIKMKDIIHEYDTQSNNSSILHGQVAYLGKVVGVVCIVNSANDVNKIEAGNILVSHATDPSLLPAMKKAGGFITNMGGLTCHAAIVARELHKPCIVGTKDATHLLKDGDLVEVDANKGIIRKI